MKKRLINSILVLILFVAPMQSGFAWSWGSGNSYSSQDTKYRGDEYRFEDFKAMQGYKDTTPAVQQKSFWANVGSWVSNAFSTVKNITTMLWSFVADPIGTIKNVFTKTDISSETIKSNIQVVDNNKVELNTQYDQEKTQMRELLEVVSSKEQKTDEVSQSREVEIESIKKENHKIQVDIYDDRVVPVAEGKPVEEPQKISVSTVKPVNIDRAIESPSQNIQISMTNRNLAQEDMISIETYKRRQMVFNNNGGIEYQNTIESGSVAINENLRFDAKGKDSLYQAKAFDNGNATATVDMPLNWYSPTNVVKTITPKSKNLLSGLVGKVFPPIGVLDSEVNAIKSMYKANKRWERSIENSTDVLANTINSNKFKIVEVPGVNSVGLGPEKLEVIKNSFNLTDNQVLVIAHSAGTDLTARTLDKIDTTNKEVFVLFLSPRMNYKKLESYISKSNIKFDNVVTVNSKRDFPHWSNLESPRKVIKGYLEQDKWTHLYLNKDVTNDGYRILDHGSMYNGLHNGRKYQIIANVPLLKENIFIDNLKDLYRGVK